MFSKRISRAKLLDFFAAQLSCKVALEAITGLVSSRSLAMKFD